MIYTIQKWHMVAGRTLHNPALERYGGNPSRDGVR